MNANIEAVLAKREGHTPLLEIEKQMDQLKADMKGMVTLKLRDQIDEAVYAEENVRNFKNWMDSGNIK